MASDDGTRACELTMVGAVSSRGKVASPGKARRVGRRSAGQADDGNMLARYSDRLPLYAQVSARILERIRSGEWGPGQLIPTEFQIAAEFAVSQGTARKAIQSLANAKVVVRRQGLGTFVYELTPDDIAFRFFHLFSPTGDRIVPECQTLRCTLVKASTKERAALRLPAGATVVHIDRIRTYAGTPLISETVVVPDARFPGFADLEEIPEMIYDVFQKSYGVLVTHTEERVTAVVADARASQDLNVPLDTPLLRIERVAFSVDDEPVEMRVGQCHLREAHYLSRTG